MSALIGDPGRRREPGDGGDQALDLVRGRDRRAGAGGDRADVDHLEAQIDEGQAVGDGLLRRAAAGPLVHRVDGDVDDSGAERLDQVEALVRESPGARHDGPPAAQLPRRRRTTVGVPTSPSFLPWTNVTFTWKTSLRRREGLPTMRSAPGKSLARSVTGK